MINKKGLHTTIVAFVFLAVLIGMIISFISDKIDIEELKTILIIVTPVFTIIIGYLSKDQTGTHTQK